MSPRPFRAALLAILIGAAPAIAQDAAGTTSAPLLRLAPAPRPLALGGAYTALADEMSLFYNPARLFAAPPSIGFAVQSLPAGAGAGSAAATAPWRGGVFAIGLQYLDFGEIDVIEPDPAGGGEIGIPTGERVGGGDVALSGGYARSVGSVHVGIVAKLLHARLAEAGSAGGAVDVGLAIQLQDDRMVVGAAIQNLGPAFGPGETSPLPRTARIGLASRWAGIAGADGVIVLDAVRLEGRSILAAGVEASFDTPGQLDVLARAGYRQGLQGERLDRPLTLGAALVLGSIALDYAWRPLGPLGDGHLFGISLRRGLHRPDDR